MGLKQSTGYIPDNIAININDATNTFSMLINNGTCYGYNLIIEDTSNVVQYSSGVTILDTPIYDTQLLSFDKDISSLSLGNQYNWKTILYSKLSTITVTIASPCVVTWNNHGFSDGDTVQLKTTGALPTGLSEDTLYYVVNSTTNTFELSLTEGGASINTSGTQSGTHSAMSLVDFVENPLYTFYSDEVPVLWYVDEPLGTSPSKYYDVPGAVYTVQGTYSQAQGTPIESWYFSLYDSSQTILIEQSTPENNQLIKYEFQSLSDDIYWIYFTVVTERGFEYSSEPIKLVVDFEEISGNITLTAQNNFKTSGINNIWGGLIYAIGVPDGADPTYIVDFLEIGNYAIDPNSDIQIEDLPYNNIFTSHFVWYNKTTTINGALRLYKNDSTNEILTLSYNNTAGQLELYYGSSLIDSILYTNPKTSLGSRIVFIRCNAQLSTSWLTIVEGD